MPDSIALAYAKQGDDAHAATIIATLAPSCHHDRVLMVLLIHHHLAAQLDQADQFAGIDNNLTERGAVAQLGAIRNPQWPHTMEDLWVQDHS